jgi:hypothetical protein
MAHRATPQAPKSDAGATLSRRRFLQGAKPQPPNDHGEMLGAHGDLHQKMYQAYDETMRVPLIVWSRKLFKKPRTIEALTSHIDLAPTLLGLAGIDPEPIRKRLVRDHSDARPMVGRDLSSLILGEVDPAGVAEPVYIMIEDDPYKGPHMGDAQGIAKPTIEDPKCIETVIARLGDGTLWKYSRYFDSPQFWSDPSTPEDVLLKQRKPMPASPYDGPIDYDIEDNMQNFHIVSAVIEAGTGLGMIVLPSLIAALLLGASVTTSLELVMARLGGVALLALGLACFLAAGDAQSRAARGLAGGMVLYDIGAVAILLYARLGLGMSGVLLWSAALLHVAITI